jgi:hypothetical protein
VEIPILRHQLAVAQRRNPHLARKLTWTDRAWLALLAGILPRNQLRTIRLIVTPDTALRWHRHLLRRRRALRSRPKRPGRPPTPRTIRALILRLAKENPSWGYRRIHGEPAGLGISLAPSTAWEVLKNAGIDPTPLRDSGPTWATFLRSQAEAILACDFVVIDLLDGSKAYVLAVIEHATRRVRVLGARLHPTTDWIVQQARNILMDLDNAGATMKYLIHDRDASFSAAFDAVFSAAGIETIRTGIHAPRQNSIDHGTLVPQSPCRAHRPHADLEPDPPDAAAPRERGALQPASSTSGDGPDRTPEATTRQRDRPRHFPNPPT